MHIAHTTSFCHKRDDDTHFLSRLCEFLNVCAQTELNLIELNILHKEKIRTTRIFIYSKPVSTHPADIKRDTEIRSYFYCRSCSVWRPSIHS